MDLDAVAASATERAGWTLEVGIAAPRVLDSRPARMPRTGFGSRPDAQDQLRASKMKGERNELPKLAGWCSVRLPSARDTVRPQGQHDEGPRRQPHDSARAIRRPTAGLTVAAASVQSFLDDDLTRRDTHVPEPARSAKHSFAAHIEPAIVTQCQRTCGIACGGGSVQRTLKSWSR